MDRLKTPTDSRGAAAAELTASETRPAAAASRSNSVAISNEYKYPGVEGKSLVNKARAYAVMEEYGVDGLVAMSPINVYYLSNTWTLGHAFRADFSAFATFPRDRNQPSFLIAGAPVQALEMANGEREVPELIVMSEIANWEDFTGTPDEKWKLEPKMVLPGFNQTGGFAIKKDASFTLREQAWIATQNKNITRAAPGPAWAIIKALKESGLTQGTLAVDDLRIADLLNEVGFSGVKFVPGGQLFKMIRMVKSEPEIALQRVAGRNNTIAAMNTINAIETGMTAREIERRFRTECAALGNECSCFIVGTSMGYLPDAVTVAGKPILLDMVSHFNQYHGDCGRSVVIGEPSRETMKRANAHKIARDSVFEAIKPGVTFYELNRIAKEAQVNAGVPEEVVITNTHSVGLQHDDNTVRIGRDWGHTAPADLVLQENMVLTVDLALVEVGWGAMLHEDMFRVTKTGFEPMCVPGDPLVIL
jgi:Xaa-Pro aminopeptidase